MMNNYEPSENNTEMKVLVRIYISPFTRKLVDKYLILAGLLAQPLLKAFPLLKQWRKNQEFLSRDERRSYSYGDSTGI